MGSLEMDPVKRSQLMRTEHVTSQAAAHEDLVSQRVTQHHADKRLVPRPLDVLAAFTAAVGRVILEGEGDPDWFSA